MNDEDKTKEQLIHELVEMRQRIAESEASETERKRMEEALRENEERYRVLTENTNDIVYSVTPEGVATYIGPQIARYGLCPEEMISKNMMEFVIPEDREKVTLDFRKTMLTGEEFPTEFRIRDSEGRAHWFEDHGKVQYDESGRIVGLTGVLRDITERKQAEEKLGESEGKYRTLYETIRDGIAGGPMDGRILECNQAFADMLGYSKDELKNLTYQQVTPKQWHQMEAELVEEQILKRGYSDEYEKEYIGKDGTVFPISARVWLIRGADGKPPRMWGIVRDITQRKRAEEALARQAAELSEINESLEERTRLLSAFDQIGQIVLSSLDLQQVLDPLGEQIVKMGIFRSLMIALVDEQTRSVEVVRVFIPRDDGSIGRDSEAVGTRYDLDDSNVTAEVARTGEMQVIVEWDDRLDKRFNTPEEQNGQVAYFIPVKQGDRVLAVLATASGIEEQEETLHRIEVMRPLLNEVAIALEHARTHHQLQEENVHLRGEVQRRYQFPNLIGEGPSIQKIFRMVKQVADSSATVLLVGETGTGKELIARAIHYNGRRKDKAFVAQNCAALPEHLLESELFGYVRGAFTGAVRDKPGLFEVADGGTMFLDEVVEMPPSTQSKLLRALEEKEIRRLGDTKPRKVDARVIAATSKDLKKEIEAGRLRPELYYRLDVVQIPLPSLRERREDISLLVDHFLNQYSAEEGKTLAGLTWDALDRLIGYDWPGNVRELENEIRRVVALAKEGDWIGVQMLSKKVYGGDTVMQASMETCGNSLLDVVERVRHTMVMEALRRTEGNKTHAAAMLSISRQHLQKMVRKWGTG